MSLIMTPALASSVCFLFFSVSRVPAIAEGYFVPDQQGQLLMPESALRPAIYSVALVRLDAVLAESVRVGVFQLHLIAPAEPLDYDSFRKKFHYCPSPPAVPAVVSAVVSSTGPRLITKSTVVPTGVFAPTARL